MTKIPGFIKYSDIEPYPGLSFVCGPTRLSWRDIPRSLKQWIEEDGLNLSPEYQRDFVWDNEQKTAFIEHILKGGNTAPIVFNYPGYDLGSLGGMEVVDGKQRLSALIQFFDNQIKAFGYYFENFRGRSFHGTGNRGVGLDYGIVDISDRVEIYKLYLRLNSTGKHHTQEDLEKVKKLIHKANEKQS